MEEQNSKPQEREVPPFRGLYRNVHISVKALDRIIIACIAVIVIVLALNLRSPGFTVNFDSRGGTDVAAQQLEYGECIPSMDAPTREGYVFTGWYRDASCDLPWDLTQDKVEGDMTLYAGWEPVK